MSFFTHLALIFLMTLPNYSLAKEPSSSRYPTIEMDRYYVGENLGEGISIHGVTQRTYYVESDLERETYRLHVRDGMLFDHADRPFDAKDGIKFVMDEFGNIFGGPIDKPGFHSQHSAYLKGKPVAFAGRLSAENGRIIKLDNSSGHYKTPMDALKYILEELKLKGMDISKFSVNEYWMAKHPSKRNAPPLFGPAKTGEEFLEKFTPDRSGVNLKHMVPRNFWEAAPEWLKRDFTHRDQILRTLLNEPNWPKNFWQQVPDLLDHTTGEIRTNLEAAIEKHVRESRITIDRLEELGIKSDPSPSERQRIIEKIRQKVLGTGACEI